MGRCVCGLGIGVLKDPEGHTTDYLVLKNEASSLGWTALPGEFTSSPLLRSQSTGVRGIAYILIPQNQEERGDTTAKHRLTPPAPLPCQRLGGYRVRPKGKRAHKEIVETNALS